jgi:hypothetical protein
MRLDHEQDVRQLTTQEHQAHKEAKNKTLALAAVRKIRIRQRSHLTWIRVGNTNTKLFHLQANARRRRNYITNLYHDGSTHITHEAKAVALEDFFGKQLGSKPHRQHTLN